MGQREGREMVERVPMQLQLSTWCSICFWPIHVAHSNQMGKLLRIGMLRVQWKGGSFCCCIEWRRGDSDNGETDLWCIGEDDGWWILIKSYHLMVHVDGKSSGDHKAINCLGGSIHEALTTLWPSDITDEVGMEWDGCLVGNGSNKFIHHEFRRWGKGSQPFLYHHSWKVPLYQ